MSTHEAHEYWVRLAEKGSPQYIMASDWECSGNGLVFKQGETVVAWFLQWHSFGRVGCDGWIVGDPNEARAQP